MFIVFNSFNLPVILSSNWAWGASCPSSKCTPWRWVRNKVCRQSQLWQELAKKLLTASLADFQAERSWVGCQTEDFWLPNRIWWHHSNCIHLTLWPNTVLDASSPRGTCWRIANGATKGNSSKGLLGGLSIGKQKWHDLRGAQQQFRMCSAVVLARRRGAWQTSW